MYYIVIAQILYIIVLSGTCSRFDYYSTGFRTYILSTDVYIHKGTWTVYFFDDDLVFFFFFLNTYVYGYILTLRYDHVFVGTYLNVV
jgi:hypothetical protein